MALISTIEQFKMHVSVNSLTEIDSIMPDILLAEDEYISKLLGPDFYDHLTAGFTEGTLTELQGKLLVKLQAAIANLAMVEYLPLNQVQISDAGIHILSDSMQKTAFQGQIKDLMAGFQRKGFNALEKVLTFLNAFIDEPDFALWANSAAVTIAAQHFINTSTDFSRYYNIGNSHLTFLNLLPIIGKQEEFALEPVLGSDFFEEIKEQIIDRDVSSENNFLLLRFIRPALAHLTVAKALTEGGFRFNGEALELAVLESTGNGNKSGTSRPEELLEAKRQEAFHDGQAYLVKLKLYLNQNATSEKYPTYFSSATYTAPGGEQVVFKNSDSTKTFGFF
jgi:hypothetical protein